MKTKAYVIRFMGGYFSALEGRIRHIYDAQLFGSKERAQETIDEQGEPWNESCSIEEVDIERLEK